MKPLLSAGRWAFHLAACSKSERPMTSSSRGSLSQLMTRCPVTLPGLAKLLVPAQSSGWRIAVLVGAQTEPLQGCQRMVSPASPSLVLYATDLSSPVNPLFHSLRWYTMIWMITILHSTGFPDLHGLPLRRSLHLLTPVQPSLVLQKVHTSTEDSSGLVLGFAYTQEWPC